MSADTIPHCAENQTAPALSALRDGALSPTETERLRHHVETCPACSARLADYDALADGLRAIAVPDPIGGYGRNPRLSHATNSARFRWLFSSPPSRRRITGGIGALAAVLLIALAFAQVFARFPGRAAVARTPTHAIATATGMPSTVTPTVASTPIALPPLTWTPRAPIPEGVNVNAYEGDFTLANADGNSAYACAVTPPPATGQRTTPAQTHVWMTHDSSSHWSRSLTISGKTDTTSCSVTADDYDPSLVVATATWANGTQPPSPSDSITYVSHTGGASWQVLPGAPTLMQLASTQEVNYAIRQVQTGPQANPVITTQLAVSHDGMRTWTAIDSSIVNQGGHQYVATHFWLNPYNGGLLLEVVDQSNTSPLSLWQSTDSGQHWKQIGPVLDGSHTSVFVVQQPETGQSWHICAAAEDATGQAQNTLSCTTDGGASWTQRPPLSLPGTGHVFALTNDGAILAIAVTNTTSAGNVTTYALYRLPAGASRWQMLGLVPELTVLYAPAPGAGILWAVPAQEIIVDRQHRAFTTPYPNS